MRYFTCEILTCQILRNKQYFKAPQSRCDHSILLDLFNYGMKQNYNGNKTGMKTKLQGIQTNFLNFY